MKLKTSSLTAVNILLLLLSIFAITLGYLQHKFNMDLFFNSDNLYLPTVFKNIFYDHGSLRDWYLTPAPYFVPDWIIFFVANIITPSVYWAIITYTIIQTLLIFIAIFLLIREFSKENALAFSCFSTIALIAFTISITPYLLLSAHHTGTFLMIIFSLFLLLKDIDSEQAKNFTTYKILLCCTAFLTSLSDKLYIGQFILPALAVIGIFWWHSKIDSRQALKLAVPPVIASVIGMLTYGLIISNPTRYSTKLGFSNILPNIARTVKILANLAYTLPIYSVFAVLFYIGCFIFLLRNKNTSNKKYFLFIFILTSTVSIFASVILSTNLTLTDRYFTLIYSFPIIFGPILITSYLSTATKYLINFLITICTFLIITYIFYSLKISNLKIYTEYYPAEINCIDNFLNRPNIKYGISDYWDAKKITMLSEHGLVLAQFSNNLEKTPWITSKHFFRNQYDFAIIDKNTLPEHTLNEALIRKLNGRPAQIAYCGDKKLLIYGSNKLRISQIANIGEQKTWLACTLPTETGKKIAGCKIKYDKSISFGKLSFGPFEPLPAGVYSFNISYKSDATPETIIGSWNVDIARDHKSEIIAKGNLTGTNGVTKSIQGNFQVIEKFDMKKIEIRNFITTAHEVTLNSITIKKIQ